MRPLEIAVCAGNLLEFCVFAFGRRAKPWMFFLAAIAMLMGGIQALVEGPRWQMIPAYTLAVLFLAAWLAQNFVAADNRLRKRLATRSAKGFGIGAGLVGLAVSVGLPLFLPVFQFPTPSGAYQIGTISYDWVDASRQELFSTDMKARRELMGQVWYPVRGDQSSARAAYVEDAGALSAALGRDFHMPGFTFDHFKYVATHAIPAAPVAGDQPKYAVLIFLTGLTGFRQSNTFQVEELVSHGYIVVGIDQPYAAGMVVFQDGRQIMGLTRDQMQPLIQQSLSPSEPAPMFNGQPLANGIMPYLAQDVRFTIDQLTALNKADPKGILTGRLDLGHIGTFGISLGAMVAAEACHLDSRLQACLMMDAAMPADVVQSGLRQPSLWMTRPAEDMRLERQKSGGWTEADIAQTLGSMRALFNEEPAGDGYYVQMPGMFHVNFTDAPYFSPFTHELGFAGPINIQRGFDIINAYSLAFFDRHLKGRAPGLLDGPSKEFPEVIFEKR
ncbi:MAG: hypothetical protein P4L50_16070 [Anaerolineaceae bacterium]|nr:hypothetical protein [Anaerolineaceae bacterium]